MPGRPSLLGLSLQQALRRIVRRYAAAAGRGLPRARDPDDQKGLHAFRVAVRRLRSLLRTYGPWLGSAAGKKPRRRLRALIRATNAARDADVQLHWLATKAALLGPEDRPGFQWMQKRLRRRRQGARRSTGAQLGRDFGRAIALLERRLGKASAADDPPFRTAFLEALEPAADRLRTRLAAIEGPGDNENIHRTRIQVKRLRYLVEPLRKVTEEARTVDRRLRKLQQLLGELHDRQVIESELADAVEAAASEKARHLHELAVGGQTRRMVRARKRDERLGLLTLAGLARAERDALYGKFDRKWLSDRARVLDTELRALAGSLSDGQPGVPTAD